MNLKKQLTTAELRKFGIVMSVALSIVSSFLLWRGRGWATWGYIPASTFLMLGLIIPETLREVERIWMIGAEFLGAIVTRVLLVLSFFFVITPIGLLVQLFSKDQFGKSFNRKASTYWVAIPSDKSGSRADQPF